MVKSRILYTKPSITDLEIRYATDAATNGWGERCYEYIDRFEAAFRKHLGVEYAIATSSCTGALHLGLSALGIGPGDEVILADTNWIASAAPIVHLGATPVFVDIRPDSWCIAPEQAERAITPRTKAILAVHLYGNLCEMDQLLEIGQRRGIPVIEDAAEAIGSRFQDKAAGSMGRFGTFSFHGTKTVTTGEGGMFVTNDPVLYEQILTLNNHGRRRGETRQFWAERVGFKYKMSNLQAAIGCAQTERIDELIARKREIFNCYREKLGNHPDLTLNASPAGSEPGYWMPTVVCSPESKVTANALRAAFIADNIDARPFFWPLSIQPPFKPVPGNRISHDIHLRAINLPSYHDMSTKDIERVCDIVLSMPQE